MFLIALRCFAKGRGCCCDVLIDRFRRQDWFSVGIELVVLILGIVSRPAGDDWSSTRRDRADEQNYLERLLADNSANLRNCSARWRPTSSAATGRSGDHGGARGRDRRAGP
jgi:hypothetical protein